MGKRPPWARRCRGPGASGDGWDFIQDVGKKWGTNPRGNGFLMFLVGTIEFWTSSSCGVFNQVHWWGKSAEYRWEYSMKMSLTQTKPHRSACISSSCCSVSAVFSSGFSCKLTLWLREMVRNNHGEGWPELRNWHAGCCCFLFRTYTYLPSGEHTKSNWKWPSRNSGFSH